MENTEYLNSQTAHVGTLDPTVRIRTIETVSGSDRFHSPSYVREVPVQALPETLKLIPILLDNKSQHIA